MSKICKNCKYFKYINDNYEPEWLGTCNNSNFVYKFYKYDDDKFSINGLVYWDAEGYCAGFAVGEKFGCIHFEQKEVTND